MARTALDEMYGGTFQLSTGTASTLPLPSGVPGAARLIESVGNSIADTPDARLLPVGGPVYVVWNNQTSGGTMLLRDAAHGTLANLGNHDVATCYLLDNTTEAGTWIVQTSTAAQSSAQTITVDEFDLELGSGLNLDINIRTLCDQQGYAGVNPARVRVWVGPQGSATVGVVGTYTNTIHPGMRTGTFPAGSIIVLTVLPNGFITGQGGDGGTGQPITGGTPSSPTYGSVVNGTDGSDGLHVACDTILYNYGRIQGGGGGGSGGGASGSVSGPGGGGGAGYYPSPAGLRGSVPVNQGFAYGGSGDKGRVNQAGLGGGHNNGAPAGTGGAGGDPGQNGNPASDGTSAFGQAGYAIKVDASVTLTKVVAGNIDGAEGVL